jgi:putative PEP-CTERM system histidine kinase
MVESPGGVLYLQEGGQGPYYVAGGWSLAGGALPDTDSVDADHELVLFLAHRGWVIDLREYRRAPEVYRHIAMPEWLLRGDALWQIVTPLIEGERLLGFLLLQAPPEPFTMNFEDRDLLRMAGRHVTALLVQQLAERRLAEGRQFDAFNRFAAFVMHDLKNCVAQLQLLVGNAARHRHNPQFVDDALGTIRNTVARMMRLIEQLHAREPGNSAQVIDPAATLRDAIARAGSRQPAPAVVVLTEGMRVRADPERLGMVIDHVIRNAQDAAGAAGRVSVELAAEDGWAAVTIADNGPGMDPQFVRERLFRPFDSTKGSKGMGVGAYQAREYTRQAGGDVEVQSTPGAGTRFIIRLPRCPNEANDC